MSRTSRIAMTVFAIAAAFALSATAAFAAEVPVDPSAKVPAAAFPPSAQCGCHAQLISEWSESMHAQALSDPLFNAKVEEADKATNGALGPFCRTCHGPAAAMSGELASGNLTFGSPEGVTCMFCHQVTGVKKGTVANTSHLVTPDGIRRAQIQDPAAPHPAAYGEIQTKAEICGACHNVNHPGNGMHLEATYSEWLKGPYAKQGIVCQDCHMSEQPGSIGPMTGSAGGGAPERDNIYRMTFVGGQVALGPADIATARLKSAATVEMQTSEFAPPGEKTPVTVTITNSGAGHYLPTGLTEVRQMWLEVSLVNEQGKKTKLGDHVFGTQLKDEKGKFPVELWEAVGVASDDRIPPKESVTDTFTVELPAGTDSGEVVAQLLYKSAPDDMAKKAGVENPTTVMAEAKSEVWASADARAASLSEDVSAGTSYDGLNLWVALSGLVVIAGLVVWFWRRSKQGDA